MKDLGCFGLVLVVVMSMVFTVMLIEIGSALFATEYDTGRCFRRYAVGITSHYKPMPCPEVTPR